MSTQNGDYALRALCHLPAPSETVLLLEVVASAEWASRKFRILRWWSTDEPT
jgi:hypothetical protein